MSNENTPTTITLQQIHDACQSVVHKLDDAFPHDVYFSDTEHGKALMFDMKTEDGDVMFAYATEVKAYEGNGTYVLTDGTDDYRLTFYHPANPF